MKIAENIKTTVIVFGIISSIVGAAVAYGASMEKITENQKDIEEVKVELKEKRDIDLEQTVLIKEVVVEIKNIAKITEKLEKKLDK